MMICGRTGAGALFARIILCGWFVEQAEAVAAAMSRFLRLLTIPEDIRFDDIVFEFRFAFLVLKESASVLDGDLRVFGNAEAPAVGHPCRFLLPIVSTAKTTTVSLRAICLKDDALP